MKKVDKEWGHEIWFANNELYCGKEILCLNRVWSSGGKYHYHPIKDETFWVIEGILVLDVEGEERLISSLCRSVRIKPGQRHRFRSAGVRCRFIEVSTTHREDDSIRVEGL